MILNRDRLLKFLPTFLEDRTDDEQFVDEKAFLIRQIESLPSAPGAATVAAPQANGNGQGLGQGQGTVAA